MNRLLILADEIFRRTARWRFLGIYAAAFVVSGIAVGAAVGMFQQEAAGLNWRALSLTGIGLVFFDYLENICSSSSCALPMRHSRSSRPCCASSRCSSR